MASGDSIETIEVVEPTLNMNSAKIRTVINESSTEDEGKVSFNVKWIIYFSQITFFCATCSNVFINFGQFFFSLHFSGK